MLSWTETSEGVFLYEDEDWSLYLRIDNEASLDVYFSTSLVTTARWGQGIVSRQDGVDWCKKQSITILNQEKQKKRS